MKNRLGNAGEIAVICLFSLERCHQKVAHIRAILHLLESDNEKATVPLLGVENILDVIERELQNGIDLLRWIPELSENPA